MKIIDAHVHFSDIDRFKKTAAEISKVDYSSEGLLRTFSESRMAACIAMGLTETAPGRFPDDLSHTPMMPNLEAEWPKGLFCCAGVNPADLQVRGQQAVAELRDALLRPQTVGIKLYAGYYPYYVTDGVYDPVYALASEFGMPVVIHGGITYSERGLLKYSHPLSFDEAIVLHPDLTFVICHLGEPWVMDTAALISKNMNVVSDLSGLLVADAAMIRKKASQTGEMLRFRQTILFEERYDRFLFGSDWPLAPMDAYVEFVKTLIPETYHGDVFYRNALRVFPKLRDALAANPA
jgi:predicted TIM-barrel fold metal-dependent hydrolase